jgi:uncharacterized protein (TIGR03437 family)
VLAVLLAVMACAGELRLTSDRLQVLPGDTVRLSLALDGAVEIAVLHWNVTYGSPLFNAGAAAGGSPGKDVRCGAAGCVIFGENRDSLPAGQIATWTVTIPYGASKGSVEVRADVVSAADPAGALTGLPASVPLTLEVTEDGGPSFVPEGVVDAAAYRPGLVPGGLASLFGRGFTHHPGVTVLNGVRDYEGLRVMVNGIEAPLLSVAGGETGDQINFQAPFELQPGNAVVEVQREARVHRLSGVLVHEVRPGIFEVDGSSGRVAAAIHADGRLLSDESPARGGDVVAVFLTGCGQPASPAPTGEPAPNPPVTLVGVARATVGGHAALVRFAGFAPGLLGVCQVNVEIPPISGGRAVLQIEIGGVASNSVWLPIG